MAETRWGEIARTLRDAIEAGALLPGTKLPSETELAVEWSVCRMTAHRAMDELNRLGLVERRRRAGTVVARRPPAHVQSVSSGMRVSEAGLHKAGRKAYQIALLLFHVNDYPQIGYLHGFQSALDEQDRFLLCDTRNAGEREVRILEKLASEADAICCYPTGAPDSTKLLSQIAAAGKPVVLIDRLPDGAVDIDTVMTDNCASTGAALRALRARGHERIAFLTTENDRVSSVRDRKNAFRSVLRESGLSDSKIESLIRSFPRGTGYDFDGFGQGIHDALFTLLHLPEPPTAVFCLEDYFLWAALEACDKMGLRVPGDLEILSFSDCPPMVPRLSQNVHRIVQATYEMGQIAANRIYRRLNGESMKSEIILMPAVLHPSSILNRPFGDRSLVL